jgi:hypothetical protein
MGLIASFLEGLAVQSKTGSLSDAMSRFDF